MPMKHKARAWLYHPSLQFTDETCQQIMFQSTNTPRLPRAANVTFPRILICK
jgi:hypothetical protein